MSRCPLCAGTGELAPESDASTVNELREDRAIVDLRTLLGLLHHAVMEHDAEQLKQRQMKKAATV